jgi:protein-tyrosine phosphatase
MKVFERVYLGNKDVAKNISFMKDNNITHVLNVTTNIKNFFENSTLFDSLSSQDTQDENKTSQDIVASFQFDFEDLPPQQMSSFCDTEELSLSGFGEIMPTESFEISDPVDLSMQALNKENSPQNIPEVIVQKEEPQKIEYSPPIYKRIEVNDSMEENIKKYFAESLKFIDQSQNILVHCREGKSRSVSMIVAYGMKYLGMTLKDSFEHLSKLTKNEIRINDGFKRQLMEYELEIFQDLRENTFNFFPQRKRCQSYVDLNDTSIDEIDYSPEKKKKKKPKIDPKKKVENLSITAISLKKKDPNAPVKPLNGSLMNWLIKKPNKESKKIEKSTEDEKVETSPDVEPSKELQANIPEEPKKTDEMIVDPIQENKEAVSLTVDIVMDIDSKESSVHLEISSKSPKIISKKLELDSKKALTPEKETKTPRRTTRNKESVELKTPEPKVKKTPKKKLELTSPEKVVEMKTPEKELKSPRRTSRNKDVEKKLELDSERALTPEKETKPSKELEMKSPEKKPKKTPKKEVEMKSPNKKRKVDEMEEENEEEKTPKKMRLTLNDALKKVETQSGWSPARKNAFKQLNSNPNAYYYRFNAPGEEQKNGKWTPEEKELFMQRVKTFSVGTTPQWGIFSTTIPGRVGYQCSNFYRTLVKNGEIVDPNYKIDDAGKIHYYFKKK